MEGPEMQGAGRAVTPAHAVVLVLGALAIVGTLLWAMHEDARHEQQRMALQALQQQPQPSAEQRRHVAAQFVCGHGVAYQWVDANTVECLREVLADRPVAVTSSGR